MRTLVLVVALLVLLPLTLRAQSDERFDDPANATRHFLSRWKAALDKVHAEERARDSARRRRSHWIGGGGGCVLLVPVYAVGICVGTGTQISDSVDDAEARRAVLEPIEPLEWATLDAYRRHPDDPISSTMASEVAKADLYSDASWQRIARHFAAVTLPADYHPTGHGPVPFQSKNGAWIVVEAGMPLRIELSDGTILEGDVLAVSTSAIELAAPASRVIRVDEIRSLSKR